MVRNFVLNAIGVDLDLKPYVYLLTIFPSEMPASLRYVLMHVIVSARILYAKFWKSPLIPSEDLLKQKLKNCIEMDKLTSILHQECNEHFKSKWAKLYAF